MIFEGFDALVRAELDEKSNPHSQQRSNGKYPKGNVSCFGNRRNLRWPINIQIKQKKINLPTKNFRKEMHCY